MKFKRIPAGVYAANCYVIVDEETKESVVLDPGGDADDIIKGIEEMGANVKFILLTHGHADHTGAVDELSEKYGAKVGISERDAQMMKNDAFMYGSLKKQPDMLLHQGEIIKTGNISMEVIETPGHTPGGVCFKIGNDLFTGDTLFAGSIGRTDFAGGDFETLISSIKMKVMCLNEDTVVHPGHGPSTTIRNEKVHNPFL